MKHNEDLQKSDEPKKISDEKTGVEKIKKITCCGNKKCTNKCAEEIVDALKYMDGVKISK